MRRNITANSHGNMRNGLISLLTVVVVISLATASVLAISTSHAMHALSQKQAEMTLEGYAAERSAQSLVASVDNELLASRNAGQNASQAVSRLEKRINDILVNACSEGITASFTFEGNMLNVVFTTNSGRALDIRLAITKDVSYHIESWKLTAVEIEEDTGDMLWTPSTAED